MTEKTLRLIIGALGMMLPFVLLIFNRTGSGDRYFENSISEFYYTSVGDLFVAYMVMFGSFLIVHSGASSTEKILSTIAGSSSILVAFFPTAMRYTVNGLSVHVAKPAIAIFGIELHLVFALIFFSCLAIITVQYYSIPAGLIIAACLVSLLLVFAIKLRSAWPIIFILESIAIEAFGIAWLVKS